MKISKHFKDTTLLLIVMLGLSLSYVISKKSPKPIYFINKQKSSLNIHQVFWEYFHLGNKRFLSSMYWIATILESDQEHYKQRDLNSWMFLRFKTISFLEPLFYLNYTFGGQYLSIIKDDLEGASQLYDLGLKYFPDDYTLLRDSSFHYYFEAKNFKKAKPILQKLITHPKTPAYLINSLARLESHDGNLDIAYKILKDRLKLTDTNSPIYDVIKQYIYSVKTEKDLSCLQSKNENSNCDRLDEDGNAYIFKNGEYHAQKKWQPFRVKSPKKKLPNEIRN